MHFVKCQTMRQELLKNFIMSKESAVSACAKWKDVIWSSIDRVDNRKNAEDKVGDESTEELHDFVKELFESSGKTICVQ